MATHADIENLSFYDYEQEVLFFPFSPFEVKSIRKKKYDNKILYKIYLLFLSKKYVQLLEYLYDEFIKEKEKLKKVNNNDNDNVNNNPNNNVNNENDAKKKKVLKMRIMKICFQFKKYKLLNFLNIYLLYILIKILVLYVYKQLILSSSH